MLVGKCKWRVGCMGYQTQRRRWFVHAYLTQFCPMVWCYTKDWKMLTCNFCGFGQKSSSVRSLDPPLPSVISRWHKVWSRECAYVCMCWEWPVTMKSQSSLQWHVSVSNSTPPRSFLNGAKCGPSIQSPKTCRGHLTQTTILPNARTFFFMFIGVLPCVYICTQRPEEVVGPLGLELKTVISWHVAAGSWTCALWKTG